MTRTGIRTLFAIAATAVLIAAAPAPPPAPAGSYVLDGKHASVIAKVSHLGLSDFTMRFRTADARYDFDPARPTAGVVTVTIDPASVDSGVAALDSELAGNRFFDVAQFPQITFVSSRIVSGTGGTGKLIGTLKLRGISHPLTMDVRYRGTAKQGGADKMGFSATAVVNRSDYGMTALVGPVGDAVTILIEAEFVRKL